MNLAHFVISLSPLEISVLLLLHPLESKLVCLDT